MTKFFKGKKKIAQQEPRQAAEIQAEVGKLLGEVAQAQYQAFVYSETTKSLNAQLARVAQEANARRELDTKAAKEASNEP